MVDGESGVGKVKGERGTRDRVSGVSFNLHAWNLGNVIVTSKDTTVAYAVFFSFASLV